MQTRPQSVPMAVRMRSWKLIASALGVCEKTAKTFAKQRRLCVRVDHIGPYTTQAWIDTFIAEHDQSYDEALGAAKAASIAS